VDLNSAYFCDYLTKEVTESLLKSPPQQVWVLEEIVDPKESGNRLRLESAGIEINYPRFIIGELFGHCGESLYLKSRKDSAKLSYLVANEIISANPILKDINEYFDRSTLMLFFAKAKAFQIEKLLMFVNVAKNMAKNSKVVLWLKKPNFPIKEIKKKYPEIEFNFYGERRINNVYLKTIIKEVLRKTRNLMLNQFSPIMPESGCGEDVLTLQEDELVFNARKRFRGQLSLLKSALSADRVIYIAGSNKIGLKKVESEGRKAVYLPIYLKEPQCITEENRKVIEKIKMYQRILFSAELTERDSLVREQIAAARSLLGSAELMTRTVLASGAKTFVFGDPYHKDVDALLLVAPRLNVNTVSYQYSNLGFIHPVMCSTANIMLVMSKLFEGIYNKTPVHPEHFKELGYCYDSVNESLLRYASKHRKYLMGNGAKVIICYFDESVQDDRWGLFSERKHLHDLQCLAELVINEKKYGVIIKSQFARNNPTEKYPNDKILNEARLTGRMIDVCVGNHRNIIRPAEVALASDITIGHKVGATASLESAVVGTPSVMINDIGYKTEQDYLYEKCNIEFKSMESVLNEIQKVDQDNFSECGLGCWKEIISEFDPFADGCSELRLKAALN
tara:strand:- start:6543 stop:8405 length:1863 start_codon:yes stop_codon:yes gene_type:complete